MAAIRDRQIRVYLRRENPVQENESGKRRIEEVHHFLLRFVRELEKGHLKGESLKERLDVIERIFSSTAVKAPSSSSLTAIEDPDGDGAVHAPAGSEPPPF